MIFLRNFSAKIFRLIYDYERQWTEKAIDDTAAKHFGGIDLNQALKRPILFSDWLAGHYASIDEEELRQHIQGRLKVKFKFCFIDLNFVLKDLL